MYTIEGSNVDLITPFPAAELPRVFGWAHCYHTSPDDDAVPETRDEFTPWITPQITQAMSVGLIDKGQLTSERHEAPLVGMITLTTRGIRDAEIQWASARKAFKMGLTEEGVIMFLRSAWESLPALQRITATLEESNTPAKALLRRVGFRFEGVLRGGVCKGGILHNQVVLGLIREVPEVLSVTAAVMEDQHGNSDT